METATKTETETMPAEPAIFTQPDVKVKLTFMFTDPPTEIVWPSRLLLNQDELAARQAFYAQNETDQAAGRHRYNCELLGSILTGNPSGLPAFPKYSSDPEARKKAVRDYFGGADHNGMKHKIATSLVNEYFGLTEPKEFFR